MAQAAFYDDVDHAREVLRWRAVVVAHLVGEAMSRYARDRSPLDDPWIAWRREPADEAAGEFVHSLKEEEFYCARVAYHIHAAPNICRSSSVPSDGDLEDIPGYLETEDARTWREWLDILGPPGEASLLGLATMEANRDLDEGRFGDCDGPELPDAAVSGSGESRPVRFLLLVSIRLYWLHDGRALAVFRLGRLRLLSTRPRWHVRLRREPGGSRLLHVLLIDRAGSHRRERCRPK